LVSNESQECLDSESALYHLGSLEHFALFKMASKMAASSNKHSEFHYYSTESDDFGVKRYVFKVKEFIEMVNKVAEGLIDSKI
jgi:hypothetical protein